MLIVYKFYDYKLIFIRYYGNILQVDWEFWEFGECFFLMFIFFQIFEFGKVIVKIVFFLFYFEEGCVCMFGIFFCDEDFDIVVWEEYWNLYMIFFKFYFFEDRIEVFVLMVDEEMCDYIVCGFDNNGFKIVGFSFGVEFVCQLKSCVEVEFICVVNIGIV